MGTMLQKNLGITAGGMKSKRITSNELSADTEV